MWKFPGIGQDLDVMALFGFLADGAILTGVITGAGDIGDKIVYGLNI
jgi:hypothetical protein